MKVQLQRKLVELLVNIEHHKHMCVLCVCVCVRVYRSTVVYGFTTSHIEFLGCAVPSSAVELCQKIPPVRGREIFWRISQF